MRENAAITDPAGEGGGVGRQHTGITGGDVGMSVHKMRDITENYSWLHLDIFRP